MKPTHTVVVRAEATDTDSIEARIEHEGEPSPELLADLTLSAADTYERVHGRKPSRVLVEVLPLSDETEQRFISGPCAICCGEARLSDGRWCESCGKSGTVHMVVPAAEQDTDQGDLRSQHVRAEGPASEVIWNGWACGWIGPVDSETGARPWSGARRDQKLQALLDECGDGSHERPWQRDALVEVAKYLREAEEEGRAAVDTEPDLPLTSDEAAA